MCKLSYPRRRLFIVSAFQLIILSSNQNPTQLINKNLPPSFLIHLNMQNSPANTREIVHRTPLFPVGRRSNYKRAEVEIEEWRGTRRRKTALKQSLVMAAIHQAIQSPSHMSHCRTAVGGIMPIRWVEKHISSTKKVNKIQCYRFIMCAVPLEKGSLFILQNLIILCDT